MFALKDESYLRQTLQRQAAALHQAAVSYAVSSLFFNIINNMMISQPFHKTKLRVFYGIVMFSYILYSFSFRVEHATELICDGL
jgi:hypothetical protein